MKLPEILVLLSPFISFIQRAYGFVECDSDKDCVTKLHTPGVATCENGRCTNPFEVGCLKAMGEAKEKKNMTRIKDVFDKIRICNSDDDSKNLSERTPCRHAEWSKYFELGEVRIGNSDSKTTIIFSWIFQILLNEVLEVPATLEHGAKIANGLGSFYDPEGSVIRANYGSESERDAILRAYDIGDCRKTNLACAHILPDVSIYDEEVDNLLNGKLYFFHFMKMQIPTQILTSQPHK